MIDFIIFSPLEKSEWAVHDAEGLALA